MINWCYEVSEHGKIAIYRRLTWYDANKVGQPLFLCAIPTSNYRSIRINLVSYNYNAKYSHERLLKSRLSNRNNSEYGLRHWEEMLLCNVFSHWPNPYPKLSLLFVQSAFWKSMMTSSNANSFCVTGHLRREFTGHRWVALPTTTHMSSIWNGSSYCYRSRWQIRFPNCRV